MFRPFLIPGSSPSLYHESIFSMTVLEKGERGPPKMASQGQRLEHFGLFQGLGQGWYNLQRTNPARASSPWSAYIRTDEGWTLRSHLPVAMVWMAGYGIWRRFPRFAETLPAESGGLQSLSWTACCLRSYTTSMFSLLVSTALMLLCGPETEETERSSEANC